LLQNRDTIGARVVRVAVCRVVEKTIGCGADERSSNGSRLTGRGSGDNRTRCLLTGSGSGWDASEVQRIENASEVTERQVSDAVDADVVFVGARVRRKRENAVR